MHDDRTRFLICAIAIVPAASTLAAQSYVPQRVFDTRRGAFSRLRGDGSPISRRPTSCSSANSTTIRTRTGSSSRCSKALARRAAGRHRCRSRCSSATCRSRSITSLMGHMAEDEFLEGVAPVAALRHRLQAARRLRDREGLARRRRQRAAADRVGSREGRPRGAAAEERGRIASWFAAELQVPDRVTTYFKRFAEAMGSHPAPGAAGRRGAPHHGAVLLRAVPEGRDDGRVDRAGVRGRRATGAKRPLVVHFNGAFHSDLPPGHRRARRRAGCPAPASSSISVQPVANLDELTPTGRRQERVGGLPRLHASKTVSAYGNQLRQSRTSRLPSPTADPRSTYVITAMAAALSDICFGVMRAIVSAGVWWIEEIVAARRCVTSSGSCRRRPDGLDVGAAAAAGDRIGAERLEQARDRRHGRARAGSGPVKPKPVGIEDAAVGFEQQRRDSSARPCGRRDSRCRRAAPFSSFVNSTTRTVRRGRRSELLHQPQRFPRHDAAAAIVARAGADVPRVEVAADDARSRSGSSRPRSSPTTL